jgi:5-formyltetrahydrofolate cyclo-ligase
LLKDKVRIQIREKRKEWTESKIDRDSLVQNLKDYLKDKSGVWATYRALHCEPDVSQIESDLNHLTWVYPKVSGDQLVFKFNKNQKWLKSPFGSLEPSDNEPQIEVSKIAGFLVPGMAFDRHGYRLGYGKGFYDKALNGVAAQKLGVTYSEFLVESLPKEEHDVPMDGIATEKEFSRALR